jgi:Mg2+/Co2+ transporter CorC/osmotically-inducible protein OsmY
MARAVTTASPDRRSLAILVHRAIRTGAIPRDLGVYLEAALELPDLRLSNAMVPRADLVAVTEECSAADAARQMAQHGRRRVPVYRDTIDQAIGVLHALDVANALAMHAGGRSAPTAGQLARRVPSFPETMPLLEAIQAMRNQATHMVLVVDERGGLAGLATLEDLMEQLLGPIPDEYGDEGRDAINIVEDGVAIVGAAAALHEIERLLKVRLPRGQFVSIGGLVYQRVGRVPRPGDVVELPGMRIEVVTMDGVRLRELRIRTGSAILSDAPPLEVGIGKEVVCGTDVVGRVERLVVDPATGRATAFFVHRRGRSVMISLENVDRTDEGVVYLSWAVCNQDVSGEQRGALQRAAHGFVAGVEVSRRTAVVCTDGPVGKVRHALLDRASGAVTHIVVGISTGILARREIVVPLSWASSITPKRIELAVSRDDLAELPEFRPDDETAVEVLRKIDEDPRFQSIDRYTLRVEVHGGVVRLTGRVRSAELKRAVEELVASARGVLAVDNDLVADDELAANVEQALATERLEHSKLKVSVLLGQVTLRGRVASPENRRAAERVARAIPGVQSVVNALAVRRS